MHKDINGEIRGKVSFPTNLTSEEIAHDLNSYIQSAREENKIHIAITSMGTVGKEVVFGFSAEPIPHKGFLRKKRFVPQCLSIVSAINISDSLPAFLQDQSKQVRHHFGQGYKLRIIGQTMNEGDSKILVCVLAEK